MNKVNGLVAVVVLSLIAVLGVALSYIPTLGASSYSFIQQQHNLTASTSLPKSITYVPSFGSTVEYAGSGKPLPPSPRPSDHIDVYTIPQFQNFTYIAGNSITIPLTFEYVSTTKSNTSIIIDPGNIGLNTQFSLGRGKGFITLSDYVTYSSMGSILLKNNTPVEISLTFSMPKGLWPYANSSRRDTFGLYGIDSNWPIVLHFSGVIVF